MKRIAILLSVLLVCGCTAPAATVSRIDGKYVYAPEGGSGIYGEYVIDTKAGTMTVNEVNIFGTPYRNDAALVETITQNGDEWTSEEGMVFSEGAEGSLDVNHGAATLQRVIEPQVQEDTEVKQNPIATITMADGKTMTLELFPAIAPITVANFVTLANGGFYDGLKFHRIYSGFMIQGGCPKGDGTGDPGYSIRGEFAANGFVQNNISHTRGVISMARSRSYNSAGSQFFIMHADSPFLNAQYAAFGMLTDGFDTLDAIAATPVTTNLYGEKSVPLEDVVIASVRVETFGVDYSSFEKLQ